eukprot:Amastigsp_a3862_15.p1 type:complete len:515 gc:universal Amastigsp_a3862_15:87-1631(+)
MEKPFDTVSDPLATLNSVRTVGSAPHASLQLKATIPWRRELREISGLAWPVAFSLLASVAMSLTDLAVLGHYGTDYLAAASVALVWLNATSAVLSRGCGSALNTLAAQAHGAGNNKLMGVWLQVGVVSTSVLIVPIAASWLATERLCLLLGLSPKLSADAGLFAQLSIPWLWPNQMYQMLQAYFQTIDVVQPALVVNATFVAVNLGANLLLVFGIPGRWGGLGFAGSPLATTLSRWLMLVVYCAYVFGWSRAHVSTWSGWTRAAFSRARLRVFLLEQSLPALIGGVLEEWQLQLIAGFAVMLGPIDVATHNSILEVFFLLTSFMFGIVTATRIRVARHLGAGLVSDSKRAALVGLAVSGGAGLVIGALLIGLRDKIGHVYSSDPAVWQLTANIAWLVGSAYALLALFYVAMTVLGAQGRNTPVAFAFLVGAWLVAVPMSWVFGFTLKYRLEGLWYGLVMGYGITTLISGWFALQSNWPAEALAAMERSERKAHGGGAETDPLLPSSGPGAVNAV